MEGLVVNPSFWNGRRVFITGHTGFKGSWLSLWLQNCGAEITGFSLPPPTQPNLFECTKVDRYMNSIIGDIRDVDSIEFAVKAASPEIVIHMAAQPIVRRSYIDPVETYLTNIMGTVNLLESIKQIQHAVAVVVVTSDKCYQNIGELRLYSEEDPLGGFDPYSSSKACAELVTCAYQKSYFNSKVNSTNKILLASARAGNVIGGGDWAEDRLVPDCFSAFSKGEPIKIRNPFAIRPWQHVLEPLRGYIDLIENLYMYGQEFAEPYNFGPNIDDTLSVREIVSKLAIKWGDHANWEIDGQLHPSEAQILRLDISKSANKLGWRPVIDLDTALNLTVAWMREYNNGGNMYNFTMSQIKYYDGLIRVAKDKVDY
jgi:CDP-glucose 4,6-dehydratase